MLVCGEDPVRRNVGEPGSRAGRVKGLLRVRLQPVPTLRRALESPASGPHRGTAIPKLRPMASGAYSPTSLPRPPGHPSPKSPDAGTRGFDPGCRTQHGRSPFRRGTLISHGLLASRSQSGSLPLLNSKPCFFALREALYNISFLFQVGLRGKYPLFPELSDCCKGPLLEPLTGVCSSSCPEARETFIALDRPSPLLASPRLGEHAMAEPNNKS